jgi:uncharacterized protein YjiS (DUF1127 family)
MRALRRHHKQYCKEKTMSTTYSAPAAPSMAGRQFPVLATLRHWCVAYIGWRAECATTAHLHTMSDRDLRDIGLLRSQLPQAAPDVTLARTAA